MALLTYRNLSVSYGGPMLLDDTGITIDKKERICLLGRNGEGKSTLLQFCLVRQMQIKESLSVSEICESPS